ncbi:MAG: hypothetical protein H0X51_08250 [Parachlamydiaceae bacterium]|nr:hypothetical protein [Parachlamydiaceae bacterium]
MENDKAAFDQVLDALIEPQRATFESKLESFDLYASRLKAQYSEQCESYIASLQNGYAEIINKLKTQL